MSTPSSPRLPEWQPARVPKLSYRKPIPQDELDVSQSDQKEPEQSHAPIQRSDSVYSSAAKSILPSASIMPSRKKNSFFGGLFAKEPTIIALAQVEADLKAKHGAATPQKVPHVSSRKMPEHVPKVNSRWDGIPEMIKQREREDKQRRRASQRNSTFPSTAAQAGNYADTGDEYGNGSRRPSDMGSNSDMWNSQEAIQYGRKVAAAGHSISSGESRGSSLRPSPSFQSQYLRSPSGTSLPEITSFFPHHENGAPTQAPDRWQGRNSATRQPNSSSYQSPSDFSSSAGFNSSYGETPDPSVSARTDPREVYTDTPLDDGGKQVAYDSEKQVAHDTEKQVVPDPGKQTVGVRNFSKPNLKKAERANNAAAVDAFLAGEARPLQLDDDGDDEDDEEEIAHPSNQPLRQYVHTQALPTRKKANVLTRNDTSKRRQGQIMNPSLVKDVLPWDASELANTSRPYPVTSNSREPRSRFPVKPNSSK